MLGVGYTLVPLIFMSDRINLSNCAGAKELWPVYMTIGNHVSKIRQMPSMHIVVLVALLPIRINRLNIPHIRLDEHWGRHRDVLNEIL
jgi:hypothetical protein